MRLLLDTQVLIWHVEDDPRLSISHSDLIADPANETFVSIATLWEIAIKVNIGKLNLSLEFLDLIAHLQTSSIETLQIREEHLNSVSSLPLHHRDPFDRLLIAQAQVERLQVLTTDRKFDAYGISLI